MTNRQIFISLEVIVVISILTGVGVFFYFAKPNLSPPSKLLSFLGESFPSPTPQTLTVQPSPTPIPQLTFTITILKALEDGKFLVSKEDGEKFLLELNAPQLISVEDKLRVYLNPNFEVTHIEPIPSTPNAE